jgi:hypothetical protein
MQEARIRLFSGFFAAAFPLLSVPNYLINRTMRECAGISGTEGVFRRKHHAVVG